MIGRTEGHGNFGGQANYTKRLTRVTSYMQVLRQISLFDSTETVTLDRGVRIWQGAEWRLWAGEMSKRTFLLRTVFAGMDSVGVDPAAAFVVEKATRSRLVRAANGILLAVSLIDLLRVGHGTLAFLLSDWAARLLLREVRGTMLVAFRLSKNERQQDVREAHAVGRLSRRNIASHNQ